MVCGVYDTVVYRGSGSYSTVVLQLRLHGYMALHWGSYAPSYLSASTRGKSATLLTDCPGTMPPHCARCCMVPVMCVVLRATASSSIFVGITASSSTCARSCPPSVTLAV